MLIANVFVIADTLDKLLQHQRMNLLLTKFSPTSQTLRFAQGFASPISSETHFKIHV
jgi:hypothetical protein